MDIVENQLYEKDAEIARLKAEVEAAGQAHLKMVTMYEKEISIFQDAIKRHQGENADLRKEVEWLQGQIDSHWTLAEIRRGKLQDYEDNNRGIRTEVYDRNKK